MQQISRYVCINFNLCPAASVFLMCVFLSKHLYKTLASPHYFSKAVPRGEHFFFFIVAAAQIISSFSAWKVYDYIQLELNKQCCMTGVVLLSLLSD